MAKEKVKPSFRYKAFVENIVDGDTADLRIFLGFKVLRQERVRLYGVNCPESRTRNLVEKKKGLKAKGFVYEKIMKRDVIIESFKQGKFGRYLVKIYLEDGTCLNDLLIEKGLAKSYFGGRR